MFAILKKELWVLFGNYFAYLVAGIFSILINLFLFFFQNEFNIFDIGTVSLNSYFQIAPWFLLFLVPALTMKSISEEENQGTLSWIFTKPISIRSFVLAKFLSIFIVVIFCLIPSLILVYTLSYLSTSDESLDLGTIFSSYLGLILLSSVFISIGILASAITKHQMIAFFSSLFSCFFLYFGLEQLATFQFLGKFDYFIQNIGLNLPYLSFVKGVIGLREIAYFLFLIVLLNKIAIYKLSPK